MDGGEFRFMYNVLFFWELKSIHFGKGNWADTEKTDIERLGEARKDRAVPLTVACLFHSGFFFRV